MGQKSQLINPLKLLACVLLVGAFTSFAADIVIVNSTRDAYEPYNMVETEDKVVAVANSHGWSTQVVSRLESSHLSGTKCVIFANGDNSGAGSADLNAWVSQGNSLLGIHFALWYPQNHSVDVWYASFAGDCWCDGNLQTTAVSHPATADIPSSFNWGWDQITGSEFDDRPEFYGWTNDVYATGVTMLLTVDNFGSHKGMNFGTRTPVAWCKSIGQGKMFYTSLGHSRSFIRTDYFKKHIEGAMAWCMDGAQVEPDIEAPTVPQDLTAIPQSETDIALSWNSSTDNRGVGGYNIYRDGSKIGSTGSTTYADEGLASATSYSFQVSAYDAAGNESAKSGSAEAATLTDDASPQIVGAAAVTETEVSVSFSEPLSQGSAEATETFTISPTVAINSASLGSDGRTVTLSTGTLSEGITYVLTVSHVQDLSGNAGSGSAQFIYTASIQGVKKVLNRADPTLALTAAGTEDNDEVAVSTWVNADAQKWNIVDNGDGTYRLIPQNAANRTLECYGQEDGAQAKIYTWNSGNWQKWTITRTNDGYFTIAGNHNTGNLEDENGSAVLSIANDADAQRWSIVVPENQDATAAVHHASGVTGIQRSGEYTIRIYSASGRAVHSISGSGDAYTALGNSLRQLGATTKGVYWAGVSTDRGHTILPVYLEARLGRSVFHSPKPATKN